jgi:hypothetical protein
MPVQIFGGDGDDVAPPGECCFWLRDNIVDSMLEIIGGVGHYTFLPEGSECGYSSAPELFRDRAGVDRRVVHDHVVKRMVGY